jgi:hypothetical protein
MEKRRRQPPPDSVSFLVRLPVEMKAWIERQSRESFASQNAEIVRSIKIRMDLERREQRA